MEERTRRKKEKKKNTTGPNEEQCTAHTSLQRLGKKDVRDGYLFSYILQKQGEGENIYKGITRVVEPGNLQEQSYWRLPWWSSD